MSQLEQIHHLRPPAWSNKHQNLFLITRSLFHKSPLNILLSGQQGLVLQPKRLFTTRVRALPSYRTSWLKAMRRSSVYLKLKHGSRMRLQTSAKPGDLSGKRPLPEGRKPGGMLDLLCWKVARNACWGENMAVRYINVTKGINPLAALIKLIKCIRYFTQVKPEAPGVSDTQKCRYIYCFVDSPK